MVWLAWVLMARQWLVVISEVSTKVHVGTCVYSWGWFRAARTCDSPRTTMLIGWWLGIGTASSLGRRSPRL